MTNQARTNGDPGGEDQFDGGCPSDVLPSVVTTPTAPPPKTDRVWFQVVTDWKGGKPSFAGCVGTEDEARAEVNSRIQSDRANGYKSGMWQYHIVKVVLP